MSVRKRTWTTNGIERSAWVVDYFDQAGKRRQKSFRLKKEADQFALTAGVEIRDGTHIPDSASITIEAAGELWIAAKRRAGREQSTVDQYQQHLDLHIKPFIGDTKLSAFNAPALSAFEDALADAERSPAMTRKVRVSLGSLIAHAQKRGLAARNVVREMRGVGNDSDARAAKRSKGKLRVGVDIPTPNEIRAIVAHCKGRWRPLLLTAIFTGLRASELRGLAWEAVDLDKKVLHVHQRADRYNQIGPPKTESSERDVPMPDLVVNALREWKLACPNGELGLVFPNGLGKVESLANLINRGLCPAQVRAGVVIDGGKVDEEGQPVPIAKYRGMHALRHFHASWLINSRDHGGLGLTPKQVQERLGHSSIVLTMNVYAHLFPADDAGDKISEAAASFLA